MIPKGRGIRSCSELPARGHIGPPHISRVPGAFDALRKFRELLDLSTGLILKEDSGAILKEDGGHLIRDG